MIPRSLLLILACSTTVFAQADAFRPPAVTVESVPDVPPDLAERLRQYQEVRSAGFQGWSPDGKGVLIATRFGDTAQLHRVYTPGGRREQVTFFREPVSGRILPKADDGAILLSMSEGGNENYQLFRLDRQTGRAALLTDGKSRNVNGAVSRDGRWIAYSSNLRNGRDMDLYVADPRKKGSSRKVLEVDNETWEIHDFSPDAKSLAVARYVSINEAYPHLLDVSSGKLTAIDLAGEGTAAVGTMKFSPKGQLYITSDAPGEFTQLGRFDFLKKEVLWFTGDIPWDVEEVEAHPTQDLLAFTANEDGYASLRFVKPGGISKVEVPSGQIGSLEFSPDGQQLGFTLGRGDAPADAYSLTLSDHQLTRWTYSEVGGLNPETFVAPELVRFKSFDGREIPAFVTRPRGASQDKPAGALVVIHGGPESQDRPSFSGVDQFFLNELGIAVIRPNVRGSAGYGKTYLRLDNAELREDSVKDIGALLDWIATQPDLDKGRVAVMGGSYGGFMVLSSLVHYSDRLKAGVDIVGIASFRTFLENTSAYRRDLRRAEYGDERDPKMKPVFERIDPLNNAEKITAALLVAHGKNDPRVPFSEAVQIAEKVRSQGRDVWTVYADNEGHGFAKKANRDYLTAVMVMFLQKYLGK